MGIGRESLWGRYGSLAGKLEGGTSLKVRRSAGGRKPTKSRFSLSSTEPEIPNARPIPPDKATDGNRGSLLGENVVEKGSMERSGKPIESPYRWAVAYGGPRGIRKIATRHAQVRAGGVEI